MQLYSRKSRWPPRLFYPLCHGYCWMFRDIEDRTDESDFDRLVKRVPEKKTSWNPRSSDHHTNKKTKPCTTKQRPDHKEWSRRWNLGGIQRLMTIYIVLASDKNLTESTVYWTEIYTHKKKPPISQGLLCFFLWRRERDSNPRSAINAHTLSRHKQYQILRPSPPIKTAPLNPVQE